MFRKEDLCFPVEGAIEPSAWLFVSEHQAAPIPAITMAHGYARNSVRSAGSTRNARRRAARPCGHDSGAFDADAYADDPGGGKRPAWPATRPASITAWVSGSFGSHRTCVDASLHVSRYCRS